MIKRLSLAILIGAATMTYADNINQNIRLSNNQQNVQVTLPANATTGYQWYVQTYDHNLVNLSNYRYAAPTSKAIGAGSNAIFTFDIDPRFYDAPQTTVVSLVYQQPWSPGQNTTTATVTFSATASSNDAMQWQKYPETTGTASVSEPTATTNTADSQNWLSLPANANS